MAPFSTLSLQQRLRGRLAEEIFTTLLERAGYRVTRLGIEVLFDEVKYLDRERYLALNLPEQLRTLPDLLVADPGVTSARLIEVKFRRCFTRRTAEELFTTLTEQRRHWPHAYAILLIGETSYPNGRFHQDFIRVVPPDQTECLLGPQGTDIPGDEREAMHLLWEQLPMLTSVFRFRDFEAFGEMRDEHGRGFLNEADLITPAIRDLGRL